MAGPVPLLGAGSRRKIPRPHHMSPPVPGLNTEEERIVFTLSFTERKEVAITVEVVLLFVVVV